MWGCIGRMMATVGSNSDGEKEVLQVPSPGSAIVVSSCGGERSAISSLTSLCKGKSPSLPEALGVLSAAPQGWSDWCQSRVYRLQRDLGLRRSWRHFAAPDCNEGSWPAEWELLQRPGNKCLLARQAMCLFYTHLGLTSANLSFPRTL